MATIEGQRRTDNIAAFRVHYDLHREILELEPDSQPLTVFLNNVYNGGRRMRTTSKKFRWSEYELDERWGTVNNVGGYDDDDTTFEVDDTDPFYEEALVKVPRTGEVLRVTDVDTANDEIDVARGYGSAAAAAILDGDQLFVIGNAREEGDTSKAARSRDPVEVYNWTQIFRDWVEESGTAHSSDNDTTPHDWRFQQKVKMIEHQKSKELSLLLGSPGEEDGVSGKVRTTGGVLHFATANNMDANGTLTEIEFENWLRPFLHYGDKKSKVVFVSELVASVLNGFSAGKLQTSVGDTMYGVAISRWTSPHGQVKFVPHPLLEGDEYGGYALGVDFEKGKLAYRYLHGKEAPGGSRDTHINENIQPPDADARKDEILSECGLQMAHPKAHGVLTGVTG